MFTSLAQKKICFYIQESKQWNLKYISVFLIISSKFPTPEAAYSVTLHTYIYKVGNLLNYIKFDKHKIEKDNEIVTH